MERERTCPSLDVAGAAGIMVWTVLRKAGFTAAASFVAAMPLAGAVEPASPSGGEVVALLPGAQADVMALPTCGDRFERLKGASKKSDDLERQWRCSVPLVLRWHVDDGEKGPWKVEIGKNEDLSDARVWLIADVKPRLPGEMDKQTYGVSLPYANLEVGATYRWRVWSDVREKRRMRASAIATFATGAQPPRWIAVEGRVKNIRDLGGWRTVDGRRVKQGMVFRGEGLNDNSVDGETAGRNRLTVEDVAYFKKTLGIRTDLDLRRPWEFAGLTASPLGEGVALVKRPSPCYAGIFSRDGKGSFCADEGMKTMAENFRMFCDEKNYPIYFHCIGGADRTGSLAYVLNAVLGVDRHDLEVDWESTFYPDRLPAPKPAGSGGKRGWRNKEHFDDGFVKYGDADTPWNERVVLYLLDCGITREEIEKFRSIMLEPPSQPGV